MKAGPQLKTKPPAAAKATEAALERLEKTQDWSEAPARATAQALTDAPPAAAKAPPAAAKAKRAGQGAVTARKPAKARKTPPAAPPPEPAKPWEAALQMHDGTAAAIRLANFKLPIELYAKLKWVADTTFDCSMTKIVIEALEVKLDAMLKARAGR